jgi:two-component system OmpR family response regulator
MNIAAVETFTSGESFLSSFHEKDSRFIVCDFDFGAPDRMNGLQVLQEVRRRNPNTPVVILSSQDKLDIALKTLRSGALDYFIKGNESTFTTVMTSILKTNEIFKLKKDKKDFITLGIIGTVLFSVLLVASFLYR